MVDINDFVAEFQLISLEIVIFNLVLVILKLNHQLYLC
jgi:hypothetical protein